MCDMLQKTMIKETIDSHIAKYLDTDASSDRLLRRLLELYSVKVNISIFLRCMSDTTMKG